MGGQVDDKCQVSERGIRYIKLQQYLQQYKKSSTKIMGCGAVCGSTSSVAEGSKQAQLLFITLFKLITPNPFLYPPSAITKFTKEMQINPHRLQLVLTQKLEAKHMVTLGVMEKWKIILFGLDCDRSTYVNCLGYPEHHRQAHPEPQKLQSGQILHQDPGSAMQKIQKIDLLEHKAFTQIEKDIDRTFPSIQFQKKSFAMVLKRISNHFPTMGYTQGINFIVGYLLIIGFSESDAFWLFIHMALNRRYLMLGLYEDGFPLISVYTSIFRNMLKRLNAKLYKHLYEDIVMFQQSAWVFKWFMTCFLSSFPIEMCQFVWDMVFNIGGVALIKFALALVLKLQPILLQYDDACDISEFFGSLKQIEKFNTYLNIRDIVKCAYKIKILNEDLNELKQNNGNNGNNFYAQYFLYKFQQEYQKQAQKKLKQEDTSDQLHQTNPMIFNRVSARRSADLLNEWYDRLTRQRNQFKLSSPKRSIIPISFSPAQEEQSIIQLESSFKKQSPSGLQLQKSRTSIQHFSSISGFQIQEFKSKIQSHSQIQKQPQIKNIRQSINTSQNKIQSSLQVSPSNKIKNNRYNMKRSKKDAVWNQDDQAQQIEQIKDKMVIVDEFLYLPRDIRFKRKNISHEANQSDDILSQYLHTNPPKPKPSIKNNYIPKTIYTKPDTQTVIPSYAQQTSTQQARLNQSRLARVGNTVLSNMSVSNASNKSSNSSYRTTHKQNSISSRHCKCMKNKTEENQLDTIQTVNLAAGGTRKKIQKINQPEQVAECQQSADFVNARKRLNTYHDWMINSQGPRQTNNLAHSNVKQPSEIGSEVQIVHGHQMFKKKNRRDRVGGGVGVIVQECSHYAGKEVSECESRNIPTPSPAYGQQESCESFFIGNVSSRRSEVGEVQSVK